MVPTSSSLMSIPKCYASCSVGNKPEHGLPQKLAAISAAGFSAIELSFPDILSDASDLFKRDVEPTDYDTLCQAASKIDELCTHFRSKILVLQPLANYEGWPKGSAERQDAFNRARGWIRIMKAARTDMLQAHMGTTSNMPDHRLILESQVGSSDSSGITMSRDQLAADLREVADMLAA
ncbi:MAG: hypothetical protein M1823_005652 [Watsoniomyces obsoletus]|nr:MAG: hypothetical protein M1823_005652 [Watsoniomyces obsoletus]